MNRFIKAVIILVCFGALVVELALLASIFEFEWRPLREILGASGFAAALLINLGVLLLIARLLVPQRMSGGVMRAVSLSVWTASVLLLVVLFDWMFLSSPLTARLQSLMRLDDSASLNQDFQQFSLAKRTSESTGKLLREAYERIYINAPQAFSGNPIGQTIDRYATKYQVDPTLLFYLAYINSFYGEAYSGPIPILGAATAETVRDLMQIHLPAWFVESDVRQKMITARVPGIAPDSNLSFKLHYAFHKATLDVSSQPYDLNTFSDVLLVMKQYPEEFTDVLDISSDKLDAAMAEAYRAIESRALQSPIFGYQAVAPLDAGYYATHRRNLQRFARAAYYKLATDFDFSTRAMALIIRFQQEYYRETVGPAAWEALPAWQRGTLTVMTRDLFTPGVGKPTYNAYSIPEINVAPMQYIAIEAKRDLKTGRMTPGRLWRPQQPEFLWGGAGYRLRVFSEIWSYVDDIKIPDIIAAETTLESTTVVSRTMRASQ